MGHIFQVEWWEKTSSFMLIWLLWLKEIGKGFEKAKWNFWPHLFMKIRRK